MSDSFDSYALSTPEQVQLDYDVAGLGSRGVAALVDSLIQIAIIISVIVVGGVVSGFIGYFNQRLGRWWSEMLAGLAIAGMILMLFLVLAGYSMFFELLWSGQTPGKRLVGIRVLTVDGRPAGASQVLIRNLLRLVDMLPTSYMLGALVMLLNRRSQRLGDLAAHTLVVKVRREVEPRLLQSSAHLPELPPQLAGALSADDVALARDFLLRRYDLEHARRAQLAQRIATRLRDRLGPGVAAEADEALIERAAAVRR